MTERSVFRVFTRIVGVMLSAFGVGDAIGSGLTAVGVQSSRYYSALDRAGAGLTYLVVGLILLFAANGLARLIYGKGDD